MYLRTIPQESSLVEMIFINTVLISAVATLVTSSPVFERGRRDPPSNRAMTWSGWMPNGGMTLFASSVDDMWGQSGMQPPLSGWQDRGMNWNQFHDPVQRNLYMENDDTTLRPFDDNEDNFKLPRRPLHDDRERKRMNDNPYYDKPRRYNEEDDDRRHSGSNANASFNAWFPIMLGMYPSENSRSKKNLRNDGEEGDGRGGLAVIANSVNHGRSGVSSSHAVVHSGQPPSYNRKTY